MQVSLTLTKPNSFGYHYIIARPGFYRTWTADPRDTPHIFCVVKYGENNHLLRITQNSDAKALGIATNSFIDVTGVPDWLNTTFVPLQPGDSFTVTV